MRLVRRQPGLSFLGFVILAGLSLWVVDQMHWHSWTFWIVFGLSVLIFDYSVMFAGRRKEFRLIALALLALPAACVVLILQHPLFRWVFVIPLILGLAFAGFLRHREKSPAIS